MVSACLLLESLLGFSEKGVFHSGLSRLTETPTAGFSFVLGCSCWERRGFQSSQQIFCSVGQSACLLTLLMASASFNYQNHDFVGSQQFLYRTLERKHTSMMVMVVNGCH